MIFTLTDVILIIILVIFVILGAVMGLVEAIGALIGVAAGLWVAGNYFSPVADWLTPIVLGHSATAKVIAFLAIFILINRLIAILFWVLNRAFGLISFIPFLKSINRLGGLLLGLVEGVLILGVAIFVVAKFSPDIPWLLNGLNYSRVAHLLVWLTQFLTNLLP
jgi:membrane protein required for colicin V production